ncbi:hypothetical protein AAG906_012039 [Vitis piasezkii]
MAESSIVFFLMKLGKLVAQEAKLFREVEGQISVLSNELEWIRLFLEEAGGKRTYNKRLKLWMNQIRDAAYDAEDIIDDFMFELERPRQHRLNHLKFLRCLPTSVSFADKLTLVHELHGRIKEINVKIEKTLANKSRCGIKNPSSTTSEAWKWKSSNEVVLQEEKKRSPIVEEINPVGMEDSVEEVKQMLFEEESSGTTTTTRGVVSIVGMGGLGKTTLAQRVYNHSDVKNHFDCVTWVYVSQDCRIKELLVGIAIDFMSHPAKQREKSEEDLKKEIKKFLKKKILEGKKYLVVLDDIWSIKVWDELISCFPESSNGKVLITTRNREIASHANSQLYELRPLDESKNVLTAELKDLGKKMTAKCDGLPLAIVALGSLLSRKDKTILSWEKVLKSLKWHLNQGPESCFGILALSYNDLPYYLKSCFLYCGLFPEDSEIKVSKLFQMWIAEGFVQRRGDEMVEEVAGDYLEELVDRSMIRVVKQKSNGGIKSCRIHDLLRDLAISEAKDSKFFEVYENTDYTSPISVRRLTTHHKKEIVHHINGSRLRSLIGFIWADSLTSRLAPKLLTVLDLVLSTKLKITLPKEIGELIRLKYMSLRGGKELRLPESIGRLVNLQTLDCRFGEIPWSVWRLHQLRHLHGHYSKVSSQPKMSRCLTFNGDLSIHLLTDLQTLQLVSGPWLEDGLGKLPQLKKLRIKDGCFKNSLAFYPKNLMKLTLQDCVLGDSMLTLRNLTNLRVLKLMGNSCGENMVFSPGEFLQLELLGLHWLRKLEELKVEKGALPELKALQIRGRKMKKVPQGLLQLKNLQELKLKRVSPRLIKEVREGKGEDWDKLRRITCTEK